MNVRSKIKKYTDFKEIKTIKTEQNFKWPKSFLLKGNNISSDKSGKFIHFYKDVNSDRLLSGGSKESLTLIFEYNNYILNNKKTICYEKNFSCHFIGIKL